MNAKWILRGLLGAVLMVALAGCKPAAGGGDKPEVLVEKDANGTTVTLDVDQVLAIKLESNPTTGYGWHVMDVDESILQAEGGPEMIEPEQKATPVLGAGGWQVIRYRAKAAGETTITLGYSRSFEPDVPPIETFTLTVKVR